MAFACPAHLDQYRITHAQFLTSMGDSQNGALFIRPKGLKVVFSNGDGWEHVSVSRRNSTPSYENMDWICRQFWSADMTVMQLHVPAADHINVHPNCLHLWRPIDLVIPRPPAYMVA